MDRIVSYHYDETRCWRQVHCSPDGVSETKSTLWATEVEIRHVKVRVIFPNTIAQALPKHFASDVLRSGANGASQQRASKKIFAQTVVPGASTKDGTYHTAKGDYEVAMQVYNMAKLAGY